MEDYMQGICDFNIESIINILLIETNSKWILDNLTTDEFWVLSYTVGGEASYQWDNKTYLIREGDTMFFQQGFSRSAKSSLQNPWKFIVVKFSIGILNDYSKSLLANIPNLTNDQKRVMESSFLELEKAWRGKTPGYMIQCKGLLYNILFNLMRESGHLVNAHHPHKKELTAIMYKINDNIGKNYMVKELAREAGMSESYFRAMFKSFTGYSVIQYQNYIKISHARDLLLSGNYRVKDAAEDVGITDIYYFSRLYKKIIGSNPSQSKG